MSKVADFLMTIENASSNLKAFAETWVDDKQVPHEYLVKATGMDVLRLSNPMFVGFSLSGCVRDIMKRRAVGKETSVIAIFTGTRCVTDEDWDSCIQHYCELDWSKFNRNECIETVYELRNNGQLIQPRMIGLHHCALPQWYAIK